MSCSCDKEKLYNSGILVETGIPGAVLPPKATWENKKGGFVVSLTCRELAENMFRVRKTACLRHYLTCLQLAVTELNTSNQHFEKCGDPQKLDLKA